jgi:hypothetical protein
MILAYFIGKKNWQIAARPSGRIIKPHYKEVPPRAVAGEARPLNRMRRGRDRGARTPIIRVRNSWIGGSALPSRKSRAGNSRRDKRGSIG